MNKKAGVFATMVALLIIEGPAICQETLTTRAMRKVAPAGITEALYTCIDRAGVDQEHLGSCIRAEKKTQDARLNSVYLKLLGRLDSNAKGSVKMAERAWLQFNAKSVMAETQIGGANRVTGFDVAEAELFRYCERANTLEHYLSAIGE
jgi:uncharacterized protein YecT (DUF1311 family)